MDEVDAEGYEQILLLSDCSHLEFFLYDLISSLVTKLVSSSHCLAVVFDTIPRGTNNTRTGILINDTTMGSQFEHGSVLTTFIL